MRPEQLAGLLVEDHLDQALVLTQCDRLAVADKRKTPDADFTAALLCRRLGEADRGYLRIAIGAARNEVLVHGVRMQTLDGLDAYHAFVLGLVRQHRGTSDVAYGVDAGHAGPAVAIDHDAAAFGLDAEFFQSEIFDIADHADSRNHPIEFDRLRLLAVVDGGDHAVGLFFELCHLGIGEDLDALLLEPLARQTCDFSIFHRQYLRQHLDHGHLGAHGVEERREFDANRAGADHQQRLRHLLRDHRLEVSPDQFLVGLEPRQHARPRAGRQNNVLGLIGALARRALWRLDRGFLDRDLAGCVDRGFTPDDRDLVLLHQKADAVVEAL